MKGLDRLWSGCRVQDKAGSVAPVLNFHAEFVAKIPAVPEQVDHDPGSLPVPEMTGSADHRPRLLLLRLSVTRPTLREAGGGVAAASSPPGVGPAGLSEGRRATMEA